MDADELRALQAPIKQRYKDDPVAAVVTLRAKGTLDDGNIACKLETGRALSAAGLHPATGGSGLELCSGDMLLEALVACAGVTLKSVATAIEVPLTSGQVSAEGDLDFRGTLGVAKDASDLILLENELGVIVDGLREGRRIFINLNRYLLYTMVSNFANVLIVAVASLLLDFLPLLPAQVLLLSILPDLPMLAIATDRVSPRQVARPQRWDIRQIVEPAIYLGIVNALFAFALLRFLRNAGLAATDRIAPLKKLLMQHALN